MTPRSFFRFSAPGLLFILPKKVVNSLLQDPPCWAYLPEMTDFPGASTRPSETRAWQERNLLSIEGLMALKNGDTRDAIRCLVAAEVDSALEDGSESRPMSIPSVFFVVETGHMAKPGLNLRPAAPSFIQFQVLVPEIMKALRPALKASSFLREGSAS